MWKSIATILTNSLKQVKNIRQLRICSFMTCKKSGNTYDESCSIHFSAWEFSIYMISLLCQQPLTVVQLHLLWWVLNYTSGRISFTLLLNPNLCKSMGTSKVKTREWDQNLWLWLKYQIHYFNHADVRHVQEIHVLVYPRRMLGLAICNSHEYDKNPFKYSWWRVRWRWKSSAITVWKQYRACTFGFWFMDKSK